MHAADRAQVETYRAKILANFAAQVAERGYDGVAIREIATAVEVSRGTITHHFVSKEAMLEEVLTGYMERRMSELRQLLERLDGPIEQLAGIVFQNFFAMSYDFDARVAFAREIVRVTDQDSMAGVRQLRSEYSELMRSVLQRGIDAGVLREQNARILSLQLFGMVNWSWTWYRRSGSWRVEDLGTTFLQNVLHGIEAQNGADELRVFDPVIATVREVMQGELGADAMTRDR